MAKIIKIDVETAGPDAGDFSVDLTGFEGVGCDAIIKAFAEIGEVTHEIKKPEYHKKPTLHRNAGQ